MDKKQWPMFLQLLVSFLNLLLLLVSISTISKLKDEVNALKLTSSSAGVPPETLLHGSQAPPASNLHTVSKLTSDSKHIDFKIKLTNSISVDSSMKYGNYMNKDSELRNTQRRSNIGGGFGGKNRKRLKIGVPMRSSFKQFVEVSGGGGDDEKRIEGFSIDVFRAAVRLLPNKFIYQMVPFNGSSDDLLRKVALKTFDAAVGDIMIKAEEFQFLEFSHPYAEAGLSMVVKNRVDKSQLWLFFTLFTTKMWFSMAAMSLFTGFVIWFIEHQNNEELNSDSPARSIATVLWISLGTLYLGQRETQNNSLLSHFVLGPWLLLMLVVSATFTSSLTSVLTSSDAAPSQAMDVNQLKRSNAVVGSDGSLFVDKYLVEVLGFKPRNIRTMYSSNEYAKALSSGDVKAAFILTPYVKVFLAEHCKGGFSVAGPTYKLGGFGFVFQKGSALAPDMSQAILRLSESGELQKMEEKMVSSFNCSISPSDAKRAQSLGPEPFLGLFIISGCASAIALLISLIRHFKSESGSTGGIFWTSLFILFSLFQRKIELQPRRDSSTQPSQGQLGPTDGLNKFIVSILHTLHHSSHRDGH